jgi:esterase/lipase
VNFAFVIRQFGEQIQPPGGQRLLHQTIKIVYIRCMPKSNIVIPDQPDHLDDYLAESESRVPGIRKDCEKKIVWHAGRCVRRDLAVVYFHGFSASRMETWPLCDDLAKSLKANLFYTRLSGHGRDGSAMGTATVADWQADALEALAIGSRIGRKVILIGTSTGGTLAAWMAAQPSAAASIHCLILLSPNFLPKNPVAAAMLFPPALRLFEQLYGGWRCFTIQDMQQARYWTVRYPVRALATMMQLVLLSWRINLGKVSLPMMMMVNPWDRVINVTLAVARYLAFGGRRKKLVLFRGNRDPGRHVLAGDILTPESTKDVLGIIQAFISQSLD